MTPGELRAIAARAELCAEATISGDQLRALVALALFTDEHRALIDQQAKQIALFREGLRCCVDSMAYCLQHIGDESMRQWPDDAEFDAKVEEYKEAIDTAEALIEMDAVYQASP
jgi:hypothetical protein